VWEAGRNYTVAGFEKLSDDMLENSGWIADELLD
jgi:hypothetical protein